MDPPQDYAERDAMDDDPPFYELPPHLAARFYRTRASARRKSSATSSRRNSLSSVHSRTSSLSRRRSSAPGCQSNYVAQHLRRASILESRKARLADRAAHVEQVRLRAALVKAAPRGQSSTSEERALAAQLAKEKYLAKVAATCAEEVARAKRIAEEVKERKHAEETRIRLEMEEKHAEVEKRRLEYQRNLQARRARRADSAEKKLAVVEEVGDVEEDAVVDELEKPCTLDTETASRCIQRSWRQSRRRARVTAFAALNVSTMRANSTTFEEMTSVIADANVISITTTILIHLGLQDANDENAALNTRTFLSAFLLTSHPVTVLNNKNGAQEQDLLSKATDLLQLFERVIDRLAPRNNYSPNADAIETLSQAYSAYTSAFAAWRLQDSSVLIEGMVASFVELDAIWQTVKDDSRGEVASDYREGIRDNQVMLLSRIRKLAGADKADFLIKKAIRDSRKSRQSKKRRPVGEVRPRGVEPGPETPSAHDSELSGQESHAIATGDQYASTDGIDAREMTRKLFTLIPSNRALTHELAIDKEYRLTESAEQLTLRTELYTSVCTSMRQGFEAGDGGRWTLSAAQTVRERLLRMLKPGNSMHTLVSDTLDLEQIWRQCQAKVFSYKGFFDFMASVLPKLCAPLRDQEIAAVCQTLQSDDDSLDSMIDKLFKLLRAVDMLNLDYTNFMLMSAAPTLTREAPGYEQRAFAADLASGKINLQSTKRWWKASSEWLALEADRRDPEGVRNPEDRPSMQRVYVHALVEIAIAKGQLHEDEIPATLALDAARLRDMRTRALVVVTVGAILLTAKNLLRRDVRTQWKNEAARLHSLFAAEIYAPEVPAEPTTSQKALSILETAHNMPPTTKQQLSGTIARFLSQAANARFTDPVLKVLHQRLRNHILTRMSASTSSERVRAASGASEALTSCGLGEAMAQVGGMVDLLENIKTVDWHAHGQWYEEIARHIEQGDAPSQGQ